MNYVLLIIGILIGITFTIIFYNKRKIHGIVEIDHDTGMCKFYISSEELSKYSSKIAIFKIDHNGTISRDDQVL